MPPATRSAEREEERRLNTRTLTIASVASASAAAVTSQLWIAGTWIAAALTPVLVAVISEAMHRPTQRIARAWTSERPRESRASRSITPTRVEPTTVTGTAGPMRVYRQSGNGTTLERRRKLAIGGIALTAAIAFVIGIAALTTVDLVSGGSVGKGSGRTTAFGGGGGSSDQTKDSGRDAGSTKEAPAQSETAPTEAPTTTSPAPEEQPSDTAPVPPPVETPPGEPVPNATP
jgi:hypothetical protein